MIIIPRPHHMKSLNRLSTYANPRSQTSSLVNRSRAASLLSIQSSSSYKKVSISTPSESPMKSSGRSSNNNKPKKPKGSPSPGGSNRHSTFDSRRSDPLSVDVFAKNIATMTLKESSSTLPKQGRRPRKDLGSNPRHPATRSSTSPKALIRAQSQPLGDCLSSSTLNIRPDAPSNHSQSVMTRRSSNLPKEALAKRPVQPRMKASSENAEALSHIPYSDEVVSQSEARTTSLHPTGMKSLSRHRKHIPPRKRGQPVLRAQDPLPDVFNQGPGEKPSPSLSLSPASKNTKDYPPVSRSTRKGKLSATFDRLFRPRTPTDEDDVFLNEEPFHTFTPPRVRRASHIRRPSLPLAQSESSFIGFTTINDNTTTLDNILGHFANSTFQNSPSPHQLPKPKFIGDLNASLRSEATILV